MVVPYRSKYQHLLDDDPHHVALKEKEAFEADPIGLIKAGYLWIKTKSGDLIPWKHLWSTQKKIIDTIQCQLRKGVPVRIVILKARQLGTSTATEGVLFAFTSQRGASNALVMADDDDGAKYLFTLNEVFFEQLAANHPHLAPQKKRSDEKRLEFWNTHSSMRIETAGNKRAGRKYTFRFAHLSEVAFYKNFKTLMQGLKPAIPDEPHTILILETTANGLGDFSKFWFEKKKLMEKGQTDWVCLFLSWAEHEEYRRDFYNEVARRQFSESMTAEERRIMDEHKLSLEQMNWRRYTIQEDFNGDQEAFEVEFPLTDREAFKSTAKRVFPDRLTDPQKKHLRAPLQRGELEMVDRKPVFIPDDEGFLKIWEPPVPEHRYVVGADSCESALSHDEACASVIDRATWAQVAHLHGHIAPHIFAAKLFALGAWYNWAHLAVERNGPGLVTVTELANRFYPNLAATTKSVVASDGSWVDTQEYGFHTNVKTKPAVIECLSRALYDLLIVLHDEQTVDELTTYVIQNINDQGEIDVSASGDMHIKMGAEVGFRDDCVMALAIGVFTAQRVPNVPVKDDQEIATPRPAGKTGYG